MSKTMLHLKSQQNGIKVLLPILADSTGECIDVSLLCHKLDIWKMLALTRLARAWQKTWNLTI